MALTLYRITATKKLVVVDSATPPSGGVAVSAASTTNLVDTAPWTRTLDAATSHVTDWHPAEYPPSTPEMFTSEAQLLSLNSSSQAFTYDGLNVLDPAGQSITFTTKLQNIVDPVVWTSSPTGLLTSTSDAGATLTSANFGANTSVTVTATAGTNSDVITIVRLTDGATVLVGYLTNESHTLPSDSSGAVTVYTGATGTFKVYYGLTDVTSACTFAGVGVNCTGSVTVAGVYTVSSGIATGTDLSTYTLTATHPTYGAITKVFSISKSKAGVSAVISDLSNDNHTVPTDSSGSNGNFTGCATTMSVFLGSSDDSANWTYAVTKSAGVTCTEAITSRTQTVTAMTTDTGTVTIVASKSGFASQTQVFSISKAKSGIAYRINLSDNSVRKSSAGVLSPTSLTLTASKIDVSGITAYTGRFKIYLNGSATATYTSATDEASKAYTVTATDATIKCELYLAGGTATLVDTETVLVVADGADGAAGTNGTSVYTGTIYQQITTATVPSGGIYNFSTGTLTPPASWTITPPTTTTTPTWACDYNFSTTTPATSVTAGTWTNLHIDMVKGSDGINGTRTAVLDLYQWSSSVPTLFPSGTSTYTWATGQFTNPATLNSWTQTPASPTAGQILYVCHATFADSLTTATSTVTWSTTVALTSGGAGSNGTAGQRIGFLELYRWSAAAPTTYPSGTSTYTWSTGTFTAPATLNSWALVPATAVAGQSLWGISTTISNTSTTATDTVTWSSISPYVVGYAGGNGVSINVVELYQQAASAPALPTGTSYDFSTDILSGTLGSWVRTMPASSTTPTYRTVCTFTVTAPTTSQTRTVWSAAVIVAQNGSNGSNGTRGSGEFYVVGSSWTDAAALAGVVAIYPAGVVYGDTVTISNNSTFVLTKYWNGSAWTAPGTVIDGSLIVTNSITAAKINSNGLSIKDASGNIILAAGSALDFSNVGGSTKPANNATVGATFGTNVSGQIPVGGASTYIANGALNTLQVAGNAITAMESFLTYNVITLPIPVGAVSTVSSYPGAQGTQTQLITGFPLTAVDIATKRIITFSCEISVFDVAGFISFFLSTTTSVIQSFGGGYITPNNSLSSYDTDAGGVTVRTCSYFIYTTTLFLDVAANTSPTIYVIGSTWQGRSGFGWTYPAKVNRIKLTSITGKR